MNAHHVAQIVVIRLSMILKLIIGGILNMDVEIYIKPECRNNKKQIKMLKEKGHNVTVKNIFEEGWTTKSLSRFFQHIPFENWLNPNAPRVKNGEVSFTNFTKENIFEAMVADHYLIKRPLIRVGDSYDCGFDSDIVNELMTMM